MRNTVYAVVIGAGLVAAAVLIYLNRFTLF
jgi:hypothetical protein